MENCYIIWIKESFGISFVNDCIFNKVLFFRITFKYVFLQIRVYIKTELIKFKVQYSIKILCRMVQKMFNMYNK